MDKVFIEEVSLSAIADAIRAKTGEGALLSPSEMVTAIGGIKTSVTPKISVTKETGKITATAGDATAEYQITASDDEDLVASNILSGVNIFGVDGTAMHVDSGSFTYDSSTITSTVPVTFSDGGKEMVGFFLGCDDAEESSYAIASIAYMKNLFDVTTMYNSAGSSEIAVFGATEIVTDNNGNTTVSYTGTTGRFKRGLTYHYARLLK